MNLQENILRIKEMMGVINEGKQVGMLYHYTSEDGLKGI
jgi:hypothetical protein